MKATAVRVTIILAAVMALSALSAYGQGTASQQTFVVPFEFKVGTTALRAGAYKITAETQTVKVQSKDGRQTAIVLPLRNLGATQSRTEVKLIFYRYGDQHFLSEIWLPDGIGRELSNKRRDQELATNASGKIEILGEARQ